MQVLSKIMLGDVRRDWISGFCELLWTLPGIAIVELKRDGRTPSPMHDLFIRTHVHTMSFSKYCVGCALTDPALKQNRFKERIRWVLKMNEVSHV